MKQVKEQKLGSETYLQKVKVQHVEKNQHQTHKLKLYMRFTIKCSKNIKITVGIAKGHVGTKVRLPHETLKGDYFKQ
jgi:hypothetical protein